MFFFLISLRRLFSHMYAGFQKRTTFYWINTITNNSSKSKSLRILSPIIPHPQQLHLKFWKFPTRTDQVSPQLEFRPPILALSEIQYRAKLHPISIDHHNSLPPPYQLSVTFQLQSFEATSQRYSSAPSDLLPGGCHIPNTRAQISQIQLQCCHS